MLCVKGAPYPNDSTINVSQIQNQLIIESLKNIISLSDPKSKMDFWNLIRPSVDLTPTLTKVSKT